MTSAVLSAAVQAMALFLFLAGAACFAVLLRGCLFLRRLKRDNPRDYGAILLKSRLTPAVSVIATPADASAECREFARRLLSLRFANHEVLVVLDGPAEADLAVWTREFRLFLSSRTCGDALPTGRVRGIYESRDPLRIVVIDKERGGRADALNAGVNLANAPLIGLFDTESDFDPDALLRLTSAMLDEPEQTIAVCGSAPAPASEGTVGRFADLEFLRLWLGRCAAFASWNMLGPVIGSCMLASRKAVLQAGGFRDGTLESFLRLHQMARALGKPYRVAFVPEPLSFIRAPQSLAGLRHLVQRDQREIACATRTPGALGWGVPALFGIRFARPLVETAVYALAIVGLVMGWIGWQLAALVLLSTVVMGMMVSMAAVTFRELAEFEGSDPSRLARLFFAAIPENLWYRQVRNLWLIFGFRTAAKRVVH